MKWLALVAALTACAAHDTTERCGVEGSFSDSQRAELYRAAEQWNAVSTARIALHAEDAQPSNCSVVLRDKDHIPNRPTETTVGLTSIRGDFTTVYIAREAEGFFYPVILHEFGHLIGLQHLPEGQRGVMASPSQGLTVLTPDDIAECKRVGSCL